MIVANLKRESKSAEHTYLCCRVRQSTDGIIFLNKLVITENYDSIHAVALGYVWSRFGKFYHNSVRTITETAGLDARGTYYYADKDKDNFDLLVRVVEIKEAVVDLDDIIVTNLDIDGRYGNVRYW